ncbi:unnamed protein product [Larinioides sclopetarius]|uniref:GST C-terminal domain-containing protein n=1 Tax=Larinioides sclopetarius TaxID=280406 RepID=A0AAV1Z4R0_9ARAC
MTAKYLGIDVNQKLVKLVAGEQLKPEYLKVSYTRTIRPITETAFNFFISRAILAYLANKYAPDSPVYPKDPKERAIVDRMLYFDIGTVFMAVREYLLPQLFKGQPADPEKAEAFKKTLDLLEGFLSKTAYVAGDHVTLADFSIIATLSFPEVNALYSSYKT